jgi:hypothetical protein
VDGLRARCRKHRVLREHICSVARLGDDAPSCKIPHRNVQSWGSMGRWVNFILLDCLLSHAGVVYFLACWQRLGSTLHCGFPFLRWQNHVRPRTPVSKCPQEALHHGTVNDVTFAPGMCSLMVLILNVFARTGCRVASQLRPLGKGYCTEHAATPRAPRSSSAPRVATRSAQQLRPFPYRAELLRAPRLCPDPPRRRGYIPCARVKRRGGRNSIASHDDARDAR